jgi:ClpP class serine protease
MPNWSEVLSEIQKEATAGNQKARGAFDAIRRKYLKKLHSKTNRNIICYYSAFLSKPQVFGTDLSDDDKNAFMMSIHQLDRSKGIDLFLHTPGGSVAAAESLVDYLQQMFGKDMRAIVPQIAMSAGTMLACSCKSIVMGRHSNLGPIDPQVNGFPAQGVLDEVKTAHGEIVADPSKLQIGSSFSANITRRLLANVSRPSSGRRISSASNLGETCWRETLKRTSRPTGLSRGCRTIHTTRRITGTFTPRIASIWA